MNVQATLKENIVKPAPVSSLNVVDTLFLFVVSEWIKDSLGRPAPVNYAELVAVLDETRRGAGLRTAEATFAAAAVDPLSDSQKRFVDALARAKITVEPVDYRHAYVSSPRSALGERAEHPVSTLSPHLCYVLGLLAGRPQPQTMVVTGSFDVYRPLIDFTTKERGGKAALAFFKRFLDPRWLQVGLFEADFSIRWVDLEPYATRLLGVELPTAMPTVYMASRGLASI